MRVARTIMVLLLALAVAVLPAVSGIALAAKSIETTFSVAVPDCAHHHGSPADHSSKAMDDCTSMAGCAAKCFNYIGNVVYRPAFVPVGATVQPLEASKVVTSEIGNPPFRPPRV